MRHSNGRPVSWTAFVLWAIGFTPTVLITLSSMLDRDLLFGLSNKGGLIFYFTVSAALPLGIVWNNGMDKAWRESPAYLEWLEAHPEAAEEDDQDDGDDQDDDQDRTGLRKDRSLPWGGG